MAIAPDATTSASAVATGDASDARLAEDVALRISIPRTDEADSFVLHAPLEALARTALLAHVPSSARPRARERLAELAERYTTWGPPAGDPPARAFDGARHASDHLVAAIRHGDLDETDAAATWLASWLTPDELTAALADVVVPRLAAAGHGSIFLYLLPRVAPRSRAAGAMLRGFARELARYPSWRLSWQERREPGRTRDGDLGEVLVDPPSPGDPGSSFIFPTMSLTEESGLAAELLDRPLRDLRAHEAEHTLLRVAAHSMLQDEPDHAPYGWSHCLTMPQAVLGIARHLHDPAHGIAVAATYVLGFRATLGRHALDLAWTPDPPAGDTIELLDASPGDAAAAAWHAGPEQVGVVWERLAGRAAAHEDAHLAKYTLGCLDAAGRDPERSHLYRAAAAFLGAWWDEHDHAAA